MPRPAPSTDGEADVSPEPTGPEGDPTGEPAPLFSGEALPDFLRMPRLGTDLIGSGQRSRWRDW